MTAAIRSTRGWAISLAASIFLVCILISFSALYKAHPHQLSIPLLLDLLVTAPFLYFLVIRKTSIPKITVLRVGMTGIIIGTAILSKGDAAMAAFIKTWISPLVEITLIGSVVWKFYSAGKQARNNQLQPDFLIYCRTIMQRVCGNEKLGNVLASEIAVFYYLFKPKRGIDNQTKFTCYRENGISLVLATFLALFVVETVGMHFLFQLWSKTAAWILTGLSFYTCLQLFAHIRALRSRPVLLTGKQLLLRNGLMGGDVLIDLSNIARIEAASRKYPEGEGVQKLAFIKGLESHNTIIYLNQPVELIKAFGIKKTARVVLVHIDRPALFLKAYTNAAGTGM